MNGEAELLGDAGGGEAAADAAGLGVTFGRSSPYSTKSQTSSFFIPMFGGAIVKCSASPETVDLEYEPK